MNSRRTALRFACLSLVLLASAAPFAPAQAVPINVLTVDCTPLITPGPSSFGLTNTMGMAFQQIDPGALLFNVTEVTPATFSTMSAAALGSYDLIAINNRRDRIDCSAAGGGGGLGTTWQSVIGVNSGGRVVLTSHDAPRFHIIVPPNSTVMGIFCPGCEPFGTFNLIRDAALWAGGGNCTGLLIFNDAWCFDPHPSGGLGWGNPELNLPGPWQISDLQDPACIGDGGYTDILAAFAGHPIYANVTDARLAPNSISSFAANVGDNAYHSAFATHNATIFTTTEVVINSGVVDPGGFGCCSNTPTVLPNGTPLTLIREEVCSPTPAGGDTWGGLKIRYR